MSREGPYKALSADGNHRSSQASDLHKHLSG